MTIEERLEIIEKVSEEVKNISLSKGKSYAGNGDCLANFKRNALNLGLTKYQIWGVYFNKHIDSINNAIKIQPESPHDDSEGMESRIIDAITYLILLLCLQVEDREQTP